MRSFLRLWAMCMHLVLTSPLAWGLTAGALLGVWRQGFPAWACSVALAGVALVSLLFSIFFEAGGALSEHIRLSQSQHPVLIAVTATTTTFALSGWAICMAVMR